MQIKFSSPCGLMPTALALVAMLLTGCQTTTHYTPEPLPDAPGHAARFGNPDADQLQARITQPLEWRDGLTVDEAEWLAAAFNPELRLLRLEANVARAIEEYSDLRDDPTIGVDLMRFFSGVPNPWVAVASLATTLPVSGRLHYQRDLAEAETAAALLRAFEDEWRVRNDVRLAYVQWDALQKRANALRQFDSTLADFIALARKWQEAGEFQGREIALLEIERRQLAVEAHKLTREARRHAASIRDLMGLSPAAEYRLVPLADPAPFVVADPELRLERNLTIQRLRAEYQAAERQVALEIKKQRADLGVGTELESDEGAIGLGLGGEITLPLYNGNRRAIAAARGERRLRAGRYEAAIERHVNQFARLLEQRRDLNSELTQIHELQPLITQEIDTANAQLKLGELDGFTVLAALQEAHATELSRLDTLRELHLVNVRLRALHWPTESFSGDQP